MRRLLLILALAGVAACGGAHRRTAQSAPRTFRSVVPIGSLVRAKLTSREVVTGTLLVAYRPFDVSVVMCPPAATPCASPSDAGARTVPFDSLRALHVRGTRAGVFGRQGFYLGILGEWQVEGQTSVLGILAGFATGALGHVIGKRIPAWEAIYPCYHVCGWKQEPVPADSVES